MKKLLLVLTLLAAGCIATPRKLARSNDDRVYQVRPRGAAWEARDAGGQSYMLQSLDLRALPGVDEHTLGAKQVDGWSWVEGRVRPFPSWHGRAPGFVLSVTELLPGPPTTATATATAATVSVSATATAMASATPAPVEIPGAVAEDGGIVHSWKVTPNGKVCMVAPCPSWTATATDGSGRTAEITDVDLSALGLEPVKAAAMKKDVLRGATVVKGVIRTEPAAGPGGDGVALVAQP